MRLPKDYAAPRQEETAVEYIWEQRGCVQQRREPIVRCRDCKCLEVFYPFNVYKMKQSETPEYHCTSSQFSNWDFPIEVEPDGFCAWGERKVSA